MSAAADPVVKLALGAGEPCWLWLPLAGRQAWRRVVDERAPVTLQELDATSPRGDLMHPTEVPLASTTSLVELEAILAEELGADATVIDVRLLLQAAPRLVMAAHRERSVRFEADELAPLAGPLARLTDGVDDGRWRRVLAALRDACLGDTPLELRLGPDGTEVAVFADERALALGEPGELMTLPV